MEGILQEIHGSNLQDIKLDVFEGPFDLLLTLLERNKLDIADVSVSLIADQYMEVLHNNFDMEIASEFLVMATTLLHLKSRRLLPKEEKVEEEVSEEELIRRLTEYRRFKNIAPEIGNLYAYWSKSFYKMPEELHFPRVYKPVQIDMQEFRAVYAEIEARNIEKKNDNRQKMERILKVEKVSIRDKMKQIVHKLIRKTKSTFAEIFDRKRSSRMERVTGFLALLELDRRKRVTVRQEELFGEIEIIPGDEFGDGDMDLLDRDVPDEYDGEEMMTGEESKE